MVCLFSKSRILACVLFGTATVVHAILAGGEFDLPGDAPLSRLDTERVYDFAGAPGISADGYDYRGSAVAPVTGVEDESE